MTTSLSAQQKPTFQVLETAALERNLAGAKENRRSDKTQKKDYVEPQIPFAFSFPLELDLTILELQQMAAEVSHETAALAHNSAICSESVTSIHRNYATLQNSVRCITESSAQKRHSRIPSPQAVLVSLADFVYCKVISRKIRTFWPNQKKSPKYVLAYVEETLDCGHTVDVHPSETEKLVARKREGYRVAAVIGYGLTLLGHGGSTFVLMGNYGESAT